QATHSPLPEREEVDHRLLNTGGASLSPEEVDTKSGDDEEKIDSGIREVNDILRDLRQPPLPAPERRLRCDAERVIRHHGQCRASAHRIERQHATEFCLFSRISHKKTHKAQI